MLESLSPDQRPPHDQPAASKARTSAPPSTAIPGRYGERRRYGRLAVCEVVPATVTYGFSIGLRSIARPYACSDQRVVPSTYRQLKADVLSASIERKSLPPYASTATIRRIGKLAA